MPKYGKIDVNYFASCYIRVVVCVTLVNLKLVQSRYIVILRLEHILLADLQCWFTVKLVNNNREFQSMAAS